jgi:hypothetical protein
MKKLLLAALLVATMGCACKKVVVNIPVEVPVYVPVPDCDELQVLANAIKVCTPEARVDTGDVQGLCQQAIDGQKMRACLENFGITIDQEVLDCKAVADKLKNPPSR